MEHSFTPDQLQNKSDDELKKLVRIENRAGHIEPKLEALEIATMEKTSLLIHLHQTPIVQPEHTPEPEPEEPKTSFHDDKQFDDLFKDEPTGNGLININALSKELTKNQPFLKTLSSKLEIKNDDTLAELERLTDSYKAEIKKRVDEIQLPTQHHIVYKDKPKIKEKKSDQFFHEAFDDTAETTAVSNNIMLLGDAGSGKTHMVMQVLEHLGCDIKKDFYLYSMSAGVTETKILGKHDPFKDRYIQSDFVRLFDKDIVNDPEKITGILLDDWDRTDPNVTSCINSALANDYLSIPDRYEKPYAMRHPNFLLFVTVNSLRGSDMYTGAYAQDEASIDRFVLNKIIVNYDRELERNLLNGYPETCTKLWELRDKIAKYNLRRILSTRVFERAFKYKELKKDDAFIIDKYLIDFSPEEKQKLLN